jgi:aryl-phospho-beta-D-glucosidase BglC (GH1 family)
MRGVNLGGWFSQHDAVQGNDPDSFPGTLAHLRSFLGPEDFRRVKGWGFDHVRLPVDWKVAFHPDVAPREEVLALLDRAVEGLLAEGLQVILDLHKCPGHDFLEGTRREQPFFTDPAHRRDCLTVWTHLARRYGDRDGVLLELLNEPVAPTDERWNEVQAELAAAVRRLAPRATLVLGSNRWNCAEGFAKLIPIRDDNVLYSFHLYTPLVFTHQFAPWVDGDHFRVRRPYPGTYDLPLLPRHRLPVDTGRWDRARLAEALAPVFDFRARHRARVACNEFGVYVGGPDREHQLAWNADVLDLFREQGVGWSYWTYKNLDFGLVSRGERRFESLPQYANADREDRELVALLRRS